MDGGLNGQGPKEFRGANVPKKKFRRTWVRKRNPERPDHLGSYSLLRCINRNSLEGIKVANRFDIVYS
jgi:hypothetical protein